VVVFAVADSMQMVCYCVQLIEMKLWYPRCRQGLRYFVMGDGDLTVLAVEFAEASERKVNVFNSIYVLAVNGTDGTVAETAAPVLEFGCLCACLTGSYNWKGRHVVRLEFKSKSWVACVDCYKFHDGGAKNV
jgi:hypothetical protein